jgi:hypothetical protein
LLGKLCPFQIAVQVLLHPLAVMNSPTAKRKRIALTPSVKQKVYQFLEKNPSASREQIADYMKSKHNTDISLSTISEIMKEKAKWLNISLTEAASTATQEGTLKRKELDDALLLWFKSMLERGATLNDNVMIEKAREIGKRLQVTSLTYSNGWLQKFKQRHSIKCYKKHGECASVSMPAVETAREYLKTELSNFSLEDIYNMAESGLVFSMDPNTTLAFDKVCGQTKAKARLTMALCTNATGSDKRKPLIIWKYAKLQCFGTYFKPNELVDWFSNKKSWMTAAIFRTWLTKFDKSMQSQGKKIALILDNATSHKVDDIVLTNITIFFLPPNATSVL